MCEKAKYERITLTTHLEGMKHFPTVKSSLYSSGYASNGIIFFQIGPVVLEPI